MTKPQKQQKKLDEVIELYTERKTSNVATAENYIKDVTSDNQIIYDKIFDKFKSTIQKFKEQTTLNKGMKDTKKEPEPYILYQFWSFHPQKESEWKKIKPSF